MIPDFDSGYISKIKDQLSRSNRIIITAHHKPDGDAMGSALALYNHLKTNGHTVNVIMPSDYPEFLQWLPGNDLVINYERHPHAAAKLVADAEMIFCLDFNAADRLDKFREPIINSSAVKVLIDHHLDPEDFCDYTFSFPASCATCELIYYFVIAIGDTKSISYEVAECLYTGIMTDTGSFRFASMTADTHQVVAGLMRTGISNYKIHEAIYDNFSLERTRFLGHCIKEKLVVLPEYRTAYISVTRGELAEFRHQSGDTEGIVNFALGIKGIRLAAFFCERDHLIKISFRSKDDFSVKELSSKHFSGGGHRNAAGGRSTLSLNDTITKFLELLPELQDELNKP